MSQEVIISALSMSLMMCPQVQPSGLADVLSDAMRKQMDLVQTGLDTVCSAESLDQLMDECSKLKDSKEEDAEVRRSANLAKISKGIEGLEESYNNYAHIIESDNIFRTSELPLVLSVIERLQELEVNGERCFAAGLEKLLERWTATSGLLASSNS
ncbi:hypothetical protein C0991_002841 [Blastosporella zonata]|nr:hypothetical protein C0991_002841 [Blastosporella zonata]